MESLDNKLDKTIIQDERVSPLQFLKRMYLVAYACFKYPFSKKDVYVNFDTGKIIKLS